LQHVDRQLAYAGHATFLRYDNKVPISLVIIGPEAVGKSRVVERFVRNKKLKEHYSTSNIRKWVLSRPYSQGTIELSLYDAPGQIDFIKCSDPAIRTELNQTLNNAFCAICVCSATEAKTADLLLTDYLQIITQFTNNKKKIGLIIAINKLDIATTDQLKKVKTRLYQDIIRLKISYPICVSAETNTNIESLFLEAIRYGLKAQNDYENTTLWGMWKNRSMDVPTFDAFIQNEII